MSGYAWVITQDHICESIDIVSDDPKPSVYCEGDCLFMPNTCAAWVTGPSEATQEEIEQAIKSGIPFKMYDDDGLIYYSGRFWSEDGEPDFGPLDDYGTPNAGATEIRYPTGSNGKWETL